MSVEHLIIPKGYLEHSPLSEAHPVLIDDSTEYRYSPTSLGVDPAVGSGSSALKIGYCKQVSFSVKVDGPAEWNAEWLVGVFAVEGEVVFDGFTFENAAWEATGSTDWQTVNYTLPESGEWSLILVVEYIGEGDPPDPVYAWFDDFDAQPAFALNHQDEPAPTKQVTSSLIKGRGIIDLTEWLPHNNSVPMQPTDEDFHHTPKAWKSPQNLPKDSNATATFIVPPDTKFVSFWYKFICPEESDGWYYGRMIVRRIYSSESGGAAILNITSGDGEWHNITYDMSDHDYDDFWGRHFRIEITRYDHPTGSEHVQGWFDDIEITPSFQLAKYTESYNIIPTAYFLITPNLPDFVVETLLPSGYLEFAGYAPGYSARSWVIESPAIIQFISYNPSRRWAVSSNRVARIIYLCELQSPAGYGLSTLSLPIKSMQVRMRDGKPTYLSVVIPTVDDALIVDIDARMGVPNNKGKLIVYSGVRTIVGQEVVEEMVNTNIESYRYDKGPRTASLTLVGYVVRTTATSKVVPLSGVMHVMQQNDGKRRVQCEPSFFLQAGDVASWDGQSMIAGMITLHVTSHNAVMYITER